MKLYVLFDTIQPVTGVYQAFEEILDILKTADPDALFPGMVMANIDGVPGIPVGVYGSLEAAVRKAKRVWHRSNQHPEEECEWTCGEAEDWGPPVASIAVTYKCPDGHTLTDAAFRVIEFELDG